MTDSTASSKTIEQDTYRAAVRDGYAAIAETGSACCGTDSAATGGCCGTAKAPLTAEFLAAQIGYDAEQIAALPEGSNMGLSCGNPTAIANLQPGQTVVDLGSGGGFDVFLAGPKVGPTGRVIGIDMTPRMLSKARQNVAGYTKATGLDNVAFRLGEIEYLPLPDNSADVVISNCVINLSPDKPQVWREIARVLKPGGYVAASDMALFKPLPDAVRELAEADVACVGGAVEMAEYKQAIERAGLSHVMLQPKPHYVNALIEAGDPLYVKIQQLLPAGESPADYITSVDVVAAKEADEACCC